MATACPRDVKKMAKSSHSSDEMKAAVVASTAAALPCTTVAPSSTTVAMSCTSLQDLPIDILENILMMVVIMEVMDKKLAKSAWIEYASRVTKLLRTVSSQWNYRLATDWFNVVLHRNLMSIDPTAVSVEQIDSQLCYASDFGFGRMKKKIYCLSNYMDLDSLLYNDFCLYMFEDHAIAKCAKIFMLSQLKDLFGIATCKLSNTIYVWQLDSTELSSGPGVWRLVPEEDDSLQVLRWPTYTLPDEFICCSTISEILLIDLSAVDDGKLLALRSVLYNDEGLHHDNIVSFHNPDGSVIRNVKLSHGAVFPSNVAMKSNGNLVCAVQSLHAFIIRELDEDGMEIRNFHWLHTGDCHYGRKQLSLDVYDRVIFHNGVGTLLFLDSELNFLGEAETLDALRHSRLSNADFDKETNEMVLMHLNGVCVFLKLTF